MQKRQLKVRALPLCITGGLFLIAGCSLSGQERLESILRQREASLRDLGQQLEAARKKLQDQEDELQALHQLKGESEFQMASSPRTLETAVAWGAVRELRIHSLTSGLVGSDNEQRVSITVQPLDRDGDVVKIAGELSVRLQLPGETSILAEAELTSLESRSAWNRGLLARGFRVEIPLKNTSPSFASLKPGSEIIVSATLNVDDDRRFSATHLLRVPQQHPE
ncbi:MAG: hypothetical protein MK102_01110 [Fuerstiella sp.]|nr:hypothetical protein [Fuerstiella sp.]